MPDPIDDFNSNNNIGGAPTPPVSPPDATPSPSAPPEPSTSVGTSFGSAEPEPFSSVPDATTPPATSSEANPVVASGEPFTPDAPPKKSKKKLIIGIVAALLLVFAIFGGVAFAAYNNNPYKVLLDSVQNLVKAKTVITAGTLEVEDKTNKGKVSLEFSSQANNVKYAGSLDAKLKIDYSEFKAELAGAGMLAESGDLYFKIDNAEELFDKALATEYGKYYASSPELTPIVTKLRTFVKKIDGQWIKVSKEDLSDVSQEDYDKQQACVKAAFTKFYGDNTQQNEVFDIYKKNEFVVIKDTGKSQTINGNDSVGYNVKFDIDNLNKFSKGLDETTLAKAVTKCTDYDQPSEEMTSKEIKEGQEAVDKFNTTLWISRWSHEIQKVDITTNQDDKGTADFSMTLDTKKEPNLKDPESSLDAKKLMEELQAIYAELYGGTGASLGTGSEI